MPVEPVSDVPASKVPASNTPVSDVPVSDVFPVFLFSCKMGRTDMVDATGHGDGRDIATLVSLGALKRTLTVVGV